MGKEILKNKIQVSGPDTSNTLLYLIVFLSGAIVMAIEITAVRIIGPYYGASLYVWTAIIAITLFSLSLGYFLGGYLADKYKGKDILPVLLFLSAIFIFIIPVIKNFVFKFSDLFDLKSGVLFSSSLLFILPLIFLGSIIPYSIKLMTSSLDFIGIKSGSIYSISTLGSIFGTILTGFYLIPNLNINIILYILSAILIILSCVCLLLKKKYLVTFLFSIPLVLFFPIISTGKTTSYNNFNLIYQTSGMFGKIKVIDEKGKDIRWLLIDTSSHSAIDKKSSYSVLPYIYFLHRLHFINPQGKKALLIGLGGGSLSNALNKYKIKTDVVEIDEKIKYVAEKYFNYKPTGKIYIQDGRYFLRKSKNLYNFVILDVFTGASIPSHLFSISSLKDVKRILKKDGVLAINYLGNLSKNKNFSSASVIKTTENVFKNVSIFSLSYPNSEIKSLIIFASNSELNIKDKTGYETLNNFLKKVYKSMEECEMKMDTENGIIITDDYNPLEYTQGYQWEELRKMLFEKFDREMLLN